jgi:uncharacterized protein (DUF488 family)
VISALPAYNITGSNNMVRTDINVTQDDKAATPQVYTIGHSDHTIEAFLALLRQHQIGMIVDVRSQPYSQWVPQFNRESLARDLEAAGIRYVFMGDSLGGRPANRALYQRGQELPDYARLAQDDAYRDGIRQLLELASEARVAVMCAEGDHLRCHRHKLIAPTLLKLGARVLHIRPDGTLVRGEEEPKQLALL